MKLTQRVLLQAPAQYTTKEGSQSFESVQPLNLQCDTHVIPYLLWEFYSNFNSCVLSNLELCQTVRSCWRYGSDASNKI